MPSVRLLQLQYAQMKKFHTDDGLGDAEVGRYRSLVGQLIYLTHSRPDNSFDVGVLSIYINRPSKIHVGVGK